jgi:hypothetical protein
MRLLGGYLLTGITRAPLWWFVSFVPPRRRAAVSER